MNIHSRAGAIQSSATCSSNFQFLFNSKSVSPCQLAAAVSAPCFQGSYNVGALQPNTHYDPPSKSKNTVNRCTCSWATYNLLSACTACQGQDSSISPWPAYRADCDGNNVSNTTYWPSDIAISGNQTLPFYAATDPNSWRDQAFNSQEARNISGESHPELTGAPLQSSSSSDPRQSSTPIGAIAGGVAGGVILLLAAMAVVFWLRRKGSAKGVQELRRLHRESSFSEMTHAQQGSVSVKYTPLQVHSGASVYEVQTNELGQNIRPVSTYTTLTSSYGHRQSTIAGSPPTDMRVYLPENNIQPFLLSSPQAPSPVSEGAAVSTPPRKGAIVFNPNDPTLGVSRAQENVEDGDYFSEQHNTPGPANPPAYTYYPDAASPPSQRESLLSSTVGDGSYYQGRSTSGQFSPSTVISESSHSVGYGSPYRQSQIPSGSRRTSALPSGSVHGYGGDTGDVEIA